MGKTANETYEVWDLSKIAMPARSTLYALEPVGMGTAFVESLTSYIARLAQAHSIFVGVLMNKILAPTLLELFPERNKTSLFITDRRQSNALNGTNICAHNAVQALEHLTRHRGLSFLTMLPWAEIFPPVHLMWNQRAWCSVCYDEWKSRGQIIYDPLLWALQEVSICPLHCVYLNSSCPYPDCQKKQLGMSWRLQPGYCSYCGRWLGMSQELSVTATPVRDDELVWRQWVSKVVGELLALAPTVTTVPNQKRVTDTLHFLVQRVSQGSPTAFGQALDLSKRLVAHWLKRRQRPQIDKLLRICYALDLSPSDFLFSDLETLQPCLVSGRTEKSPHLKPRFSLPKSSVSQLQKALENASKSDKQPPPTVNGIARSFGCSSSKLYMRWPELCHTIAARYLAYVSARKSARMQRLRTEIREAAFQLYAEGKPITKNQISPLLAKPGYMRSPELRGFVEGIRRELEGRNTRASSDL